MDERAIHRVVDVVVVVLVVVVRDGVAQCHDLTVP
jgi:hypothetical protein